jgi:hypothetical protein
MVVFSTRAGQELRPLGNAAPRSEYCFTIRIWDGVPVGYRDTKLASRRVVSENQQLTVVTHQQVMNRAAAETGLPR